MPILSVDRPPRRPWRTWLGICALAAGTLTIVLQPALAARRDDPPGASPSHPIPDGWQAVNFRPLAYLDLDHITFKMTLARRAGRTFLLVGAPGGANPDGRTFEGFSVVDVTVPRAPRLVRSVPVKFASGQLTSDGSSLVVGQVRLGERRKMRRKGARSEFFSLYSLGDPSHPRPVATFLAQGQGTHRNAYPGGRYLYLSSELDGYHHNILQIVDLGDPRHPREAGRYWLPGQGPGEQVPPGPIGFHGPVDLSPDGRTATMGYSPAMINLDVGDPARPRPIGSLAFAPTDSDGMTFMHTGQALFDGYVHVNTEPHANGCKGQSLSFAAIVDNSDPERPLLASYYPRPQLPPGAPYKSFCDLPQWFGMHNINQEGHNPAARAARKLVFATYFSAGLRAYDLSDPRFPREVGWFLPSSPGLQRGGADDVIADRRGYVFVTNSFGKGLWILEYTGPDPDNP